MPERRLAAIDVKPGAAMESQSGLQMLRPRIYGAYEVPDGGTRTAAIVMHPTSNFMGHYLIGPLAARGIACLGLNSRYAGNDTVLLMERVLQDLGAGVRFAREALGCDRVLLVGNSGGAALAAFYQAEAEQLTAETFVDGDPTHLVAADLPPVDGIALCAAHEGRSHLFGRWLDPSVLDEHDALATDPSLDMYDPIHWTGGPDAPPRFSTAFLHRFVAAQQRRRERIERRVRERLAQLRSTPGAPRDEAFVVHRTHADPRCLDLTLDSNDRARGSVWGDARAVNYAANAMGTDDLAHGLPLAVVERLAGQRAGEPGPHFGAGPAPDLHRRPEHVPEHARRLARRRRRAHPQRRRRRRRPLPGRARRPAGAGRRRDRRLCRIAVRWRDEQHRDLEVRAELRAAALALRRAARPRRRRAHPLPRRHRGRRPGRPDARLRPGPARRARRAARRGRHGRRQGRIVARHLLRAEEPRDLRALRHLRAHPPEGHHLVGGPHVLGP
jgi:hypothetical protein